MNNAGKKRFLCKRMRSRVVKYVYSFLGLAVLSFVAMTAYRRGHDANVYLHAASQLLAGENIYINNPYNEYLYSPFFALILSPLSMLDFSMARVIWALANALMAWRMFMILRSVVRRQSGLADRSVFLWSLGTVVISIGYLLHNLNLGQSTVFILWLTGEGLYQVLIKKRSFIGGALIAIGVNVKIIPILAFYYLFFRGRWKALVAGALVFMLCLALPALFVGMDYTYDLHVKWVEKINPSSEKYVFENSHSTHSLNAMLPAYLYSFDEPEENPYDLPRRLASVSYETLVIVLQGVRLALVLSFLYLVFHPRRKRFADSAWFYWCFAYLGLIIILIFPHQQKYAMLYSVPAGSYLLWRFLIYKESWSSVVFWRRCVFMVALFLLLLSAVSGRDIIGDKIVNIIDFYHVSTWINLVFLAFLWVNPPLDDL